MSAVPSLSGTVPFVQFAATDQFPFVGQFHVKVAADAMVVRALRDRQRREAPGAVDDGGEAFLRIVEDVQICEQPREFRGQGHGDKRFPR